MTYGPLFFELSGHALLDLPHANGLPSGSSPSGSRRSNSHTRPEAWTERPGASKHGSTSPSPVDRCTISCSPGWTIVRTANTATRERGIDVVAERAGERAGVEVKGYPSRLHVAGPKKGQLKSSTPANQAPKWFAHALVPAMKLRSREPETRSVICFPDFTTYRNLFEATASSLAAAGIEVWVVTQAGEVEVLG